MMGNMGKVTTYYAVRVLPLLLALTALLPAPAARAVSVEGVDFAEAVKTGGDGTELVLNGVGVRHILLVKVYVAALYLPAKNDDGEAILQSNQPSRLEMHVLRNLTVEQLKSSITGALRETLTPEQKAPLQARLEQLDGIFESLDALKKGTSFVIDYRPNTGTHVQMNGEDKGTILGADFHEALLRMWIGDKPRDPHLRKALLGMP
jgi:hypothetical protein